MVSTAGGTLEFMAGRSPTETPDMETREPCMRRRVLLHTPVTENYRVTFLNAIIFKKTGQAPQRKNQEAQKVVLI